MTPSVVPDVPDHFDPVWETIPAGAELHRVHTALRKVTDYNPGIGGPNRFAFFKDNDGAPVPVLYAAMTEKAAVCESVLHDIPASGGLLLSKSYESCLCGRMTTTRDLRVVSYRGEGLRRFGLEPHQLTATAATEYRRTVLWAQAAWRHGADGVVWMSSKLNSDPAVALFPSAANAILASSGVPRVFLNGPDLDWLIDFCASIRIDVDLSV